MSKLANTKRKGENKSVTQEVLPRPSIEKSSSTLDVCTISDNNCWMTPVYNYLTTGELPSDQKEAGIVRRKACSYVLVEGRLYIRGF